MATLSKEEQEKRKKQAQEYYASRPDTQTIKKLQNDYALASDLNTLSRKQESEKGYVNNELRNEYSKVTQQVKSNESLYKQYFGESAYNSTIKSGIDALTKYNSSALTKDEKKEQLKENKKSARKDTFNSWLEYMQARITKSDDEDAAERQYQSDKSRYKEYKEQQKENYYTDQSTNTETLQNDKEAAELVEQLYETEQIEQNAQDTLNSIYMNNPAFWYGDTGQSYQKTADDASAKIDEITKQLKEKGYDAESLLDTYTRTKNEQTMQADMEEVADFAEEHPLLSTAAYTAANVAQVGALPDLLQNATYDLFNGDGDYKPLDTNSSGFAATHFRNTISETNSENLKESVTETADNLKDYVLDNTESEAIKKFVLKTTDSEEIADSVVDLYSSALTMGDSLTYSIMPKALGKVVMFSSAAASTAIDATERGLDSENAELTSIAAGLAEVIGESCGVDSLFKIVGDVGKSGVKNAIKDILKQFINEGSEEVFTDILNAISDQVINGDESAIMQEYQSYIDSGMTESEANKETAKSFGEQVGESFLAGAFAGGVMGAGGVVVQRVVNNTATYNTYGENIKNSENAQETIQSLIDTGLESNDKSDKAYKLASEIQEKLNKNVEKTGGTENGNDVLTGSSIESTQYDYSKVSSTKLGELAISVQQQSIRNNINLAIDGTTNAEKVSKAVKHLTTGGSMSVSDARAISNSPTAVNAINEQLGTNFATTDITTKTLKNISTALASGQTDLSYLNGNGADLESEDNTEFEDYGIDENGNVVKNQSANDTYTIEAKHDSGAKLYINSARPLEINDEGVFLNTTDGKVDYSDAEIGDAETRTLLEDVIKDTTIGNTGANAIYANYKNADDSLSTYQYFRQADIMYQAGQANNISFEKYKAKNPQYEAIYTLLGDGAENIYRSGQTDNTLRDKIANRQKAEKAEKKKESKKKAPKAKGKGTYTNDSDVDSDVETVLKTLAKVTNYDYVSKNEKGRNGTISSELATVIISTAKGKEYQTAIHENVHYIAEHNQEGYEQLKNALLDWYKDNSGDKRYNAIKNKYANAYETNGNKMTNAELDEELVADATAAIFTTEDGIEQFAEYVAEKSEPEKKSIKEAFTDLINRIVETIKKALSRGSLSNYQREYLEMEQKQAEEIRTLFLSSLDKAAENYKSEIQEQTDTSEQKNNTAEGDAKYSIAIDDEGKYVSIDTDQQMFDGKSTQESISVINKYMKDKFKGKVFPLSNDNKAYVGYKGINEYTRPARKNIDDNVYSAKLKAGTELDNLLAISEFIEHTEDSGHHPEAVGGWDYYKTIFKVNDKFYEGKISIEIRDNGREFKDITKIKETNRNASQNANASADATDFFNNSISQDSTNVNGKNSFDVDEPVEEVRNLVAVHNITEENLLKSLELGGLPMPSIAVMEARNAKGNDTFGEISLIFPREAIDPEANSDNKVYGSDVWSPTYPTVEYKLNEKKADEIYSRAREASKKKLPLAFNSVYFAPQNLEDRNGRISIDNPQDSIDVKLLYLAENDINVEKQTKENRTEMSKLDVETSEYLLEHMSNEFEVLKNKELTGTEWLKEYGDKFEQTRRELYKQDGLTDETIDSIFASEKGFEKIKIANRAVKYAEEGAVETEIVDDTEATYKLIDKSIDEDDYNKWVDELFDGIIEKKGIRNDKDAYTSSGNRRSWETLHYEENLENVVKQMKSQENGDSFFSGNQLWAVAAKQYGTIEELKADSNRLQTLTDEEYSKIKQEFGERFTEIANSILNSKNNDIIVAYTNITDAVRNSKTKSGVLNYLKTYYGDSVNTNTVDDILDLIADVGNMPISYFEAKPQRALDFNEVATALIPESSSQQLRDGLDSLGISYIEYDGENENARQDTLNDYLENENDVRFSLDVDEYDENEYNNLEVGKERYANLYSEALTWDADKVNQICYRYLNGYKYVYYFDNEYNMNILAKEKSKNIHEKGEVESVDGQGKGISSGFEVSQRRNGTNLYTAGNVENTEATGRNDKFTGKEVSAERRSDGAGNVETGDYDNSAEKNSINVEDTDGKESRTVKYVDAAIPAKKINQLEQKNERLQEALEYQKHELELTGGVEVSRSATYNIGSWIKKTHFPELKGVTNKYIGEKIQEIVESVNKETKENYERNKYSSERAYYDKLWDKIRNLVVDLEETGLYEEKDPYAEEALKNLKERGPIYFTESQKKDIINNYDSMSSYRRRIAGIITIRKDSGRSQAQNFYALSKAIGVEEARKKTQSAGNAADVMREFFDKYPELFPEEYEYTLDDQAGTALLEVAERLQEMLRPSSDELRYITSNNAEYIDQITTETIEKCLDLGTRETFADKKEREIRNTKAKYKNKIADIKKADKEKYDAALKKVKERERKRLEQLKDKNKEKIMDLKTQQRAAIVEMRREERAKLKNSEEMRKTKESIRRSLMKVSTLAKQEKKNHIPNNMINAVKELIETVAPESFTYNSANGIKITQQLNNLTNIFTSERTYSDNHDTYSVYTNLYNDTIESMLENLKESVKNKTVGEMNLKELRDVDNIVKMTLKTIQDMNELYINEQRISVDKQARKVSEEIGQAKRIEASKRGSKSRKMFYGNMKPTYFFKYLGSKTLEDAYKRLRNGEDKWAVITYEAKSYANEVRSKYDWKNWNFKEKQELKTTAGETLNLSLPQLMAIYANSRREQNRGHMLNGGIEFSEEQSLIDDVKKQITDKRADRKGKYVQPNKIHKMSENDLKKVAQMLTTEQKEYVQEMVEYLSTTMAEYGNEVSREMYDVELFKERNYYPAKVDKKFTNSDSSPTNLKATRHIINSGFTKATQENASNPLLLEDFDDVWAGHINEMATYNAFAVEVENFNKVFNYQETENHEYSSIKSQLETSYGAEAVEYINKLLEDINGGVMNDSSAVGGLLTKWKKTAVGSNLSVIVQQPSAIGRALSVIDTKYFAKTAVSKRDYEEIKKYAPVAIIKEMGYFDTNMAQSTVDYLNNPEYDGLKEKVRGFFTDGNYRDEAFGYFANKADELTWAHIWNACKAESRDIHSDLSVDEQLEKAGERFTQVITETQVYDSVFSRSQWMRSKDGLNELLTAFMAEPTTSYNMLQNAIVQRQRGTMSKKQSARIVGSLVAASMINAIFQSLVTAARDDDDDKSYLEKYISEIPGNFLGNVSPLNWLPIVKDIISIFNGYDVSRSDMALISDVYDALEDATDENKTLEEKAESIVGAFGNLCGIPLKNIIRDTKSVINVVNSAKNGMLTTMSGTSIKEGIKAGVSDATLWNEILSFFGVDVLEEKDKNQLIYEAIMNGDDDTYNRIANNLENPDNYIKQGLIEYDIRVAEAGIAYASGDVGTMIDTADELESDGFDYELALKAIKSYSNKIETAAKKLNEDDESGYNDAIAELTASGADRDDVIEAVENVEVSESEESSESALYSSNDLYYAVKSKNEDATNTIIDNIKQTYIANGKSEDDAEELAENKLETAYTRVMYEDIKLAEAAIDYSGGDVDALIDGAEYFKNEDFDYDLAVKAIKKYVSTMESAKKAKDEGDTLTYNDKLDDLLAGGIDKNTLEKAIDKIEVDTSDSDSNSESKLYSGDDLYNAVKNGNTKTFKTVFEANVKTEVKNGKTQEEAEETVKKSIQTKFKKDYQSETSENRKKIVQQLKNTGLYTDEEINKMVAESYTMNGVITDALDTNDATTIQKYVSERISAKVAGGMDEDNAKYGLKTSIMNAYKDEYLSGDADTKAKIISIMVKTGIYGNRSEVLAYIKEKWTE